MARQAKDKTNAHMIERGDRMRKNWDAPVTRLPLNGEADNVKMKLKIGNTTVMICDDSYINHTPEYHKQRWANFSRIVMDNAMRAQNTKEEST
ncbi:MAG: hypothetical protein KH354_06215 [Clostridiales bacterium]|nr:hypothetical protein [Clostridiales bacterium]